MRVFEVDSSSAIGLKLFGSALDFQEIQFQVLFLDGGDFPPRELLLSPRFHFGPNIGNPPSKMASFSVSPFPVLLRFQE